MAKRKKGITKATTDSTATPPIQSPIRLTDERNPNSQRGNVSGVKNGEGQEEENATNVRVLGKIEIILKQAQQEATKNTSDDEVHSAIKECLQKLQNQKQTSMKNNGSEEGEIGEIEQANRVQTGTVWDTFDVLKLRNAGCKLQYMPPETIQGQVIGKIGVEDVHTEVESGNQPWFVMYWEQILHSQ